MYYTLLLFHLSLLFNGGERRILTLPNITPRVHRGWLHALNDARPPVTAKAFEDYKQRETN